MTQHNSPDPGAPAIDDNALGTLVIEVFRLNGALLGAGDALVRDLGLTSARWQVLGALALAGVPLPVPHIARNMGLTRQAVQRVVDDMRGVGLVRLDPNAHHRKSMLVALTDSGRAAYREASARQRQWANDLAGDVPRDALHAAAQLLAKLHRRLALPSKGA
jgi:DNA-binding MarR family transcriptional regulator